MSDVSAFLNFDIVDAYTEYKRRQKILTGWLVKNTDNDANAKYSLRQIEEMAEDAVSRQVAISSDILYLASSLVQLRREVGLHYQDGDTGHLKCIASLQTIVAYLKQLPVLRLPYTHERDLIDTSAQFCGTTNRFDLLRSLAKKQHIYVQPVLPSVSQVKSQDEQTELQAIAREKLGVAFFHMQTAMIHAYQSCIDAHHGRKSWLVAAYILERAYINMVMKWLFMMTQWELYAGTRSQNSSDTELLEDITREIETFTRTADDDHPLKRCPSPKLDTIAQLEYLLTFMDCLLRDPKSQQAISASKRMLRYNHLVPDPTSNDEEQEDIYYMKLLQCLELDNYHHRISVPPSRKHMRVLEICNLFAYKPMYGITTIMASTLQVLLKSAQCFEFGRTNNVDMSIASNQNPPNYRLKALSFMREALDTLDQYGPSSEPWMAPPCSYQNLTLLRVKLVNYLKDNRFDLVTQHPAIAGGDVLLVMDVLYGASFKLVAYHRGVLGVMHIYNALQSLNVLKKKIPILEGLCDKLVGPVFYGNRPTKKFLREFRDLDSNEHTFRFSAREYKTIRPQNILNRGIPAFDDSEEPWELSERGQYQYEEGRFGINQRLQADDFSLFHRIYNQKNDLENDIDPLILKELVGDAAAFLASSDIPGSNPKLMGKSREAARKEMNDRQSFCSSDCRLDILEEALVKEFGDDFSLININLIKVWRVCFNVLRRLGAQGDYNTGIGDQTRLKTALQACEEVQRQGADGTVVSLPKDHILSKWKRAFKKEFGGTTLQDFMWQNL